MANARATPARQYQGESQARRARIYSSAHLYPRLQQNSPQVRNHYYPPRGDNNKEGWDMNIDISAGLNYKMHIR